MFEDAFRKVCKLKESPLIDIEFEDLTYKVKSGQSTKPILKSINGKFHSGEMTAILGASGSGKTTLLNILAGITSDGTNNSVKINGMPRDMKTFRRLSAYIMQDDLLQLYLTVEELMMTAAKLKLGSNINFQERMSVISNILNELGLEKCSKTLTNHLSGGQKKRLSIALEMISNPPLIFLDEPTSGLDTVSTNQCLAVLKRLANEGRTVVCTIHQPSAYSLQNFNQIYVIHNGMCVYNGLTSNIIPYMSSLGYDCPSTYNPADYILETVQTIPETVLILKDGIRNGKINKREVDTLRNNKEDASNNNHEMGQTFNFQTIDKFRTPFWLQFQILLFRMMRQMVRNATSAWILLIHTVLCSVLCGSIFYQVGNNAETIIFSFNYFICFLIFFIYTHVMKPVLVFPTEVKLIKREYYNQWYDLKSYFAALSLVNLPIMVLICLVFVTTTYLLSSQPLELNRFVTTLIVGILTSAIAESFGLMIGSTFNVTNGSAVAPTATALFIMLSFYGSGYGSQVSSTMKMALKISYLRVALVTMGQALVGNNRAPLECNDETLYCHYQDPQDVLKDLGMLNESINLNILGLVIYLLLFRVSAFFLLRFRLTGSFFLRNK